VRAEQFWNHPAVIDEDIRASELYPAPAPNEDRFDLRFMAKLCKKEKVQVLDLGCGTGMLRHCLPSDVLKSYTGMDMSSGLIAFARERNTRDRFWEASIQEMAEVRRNERFDVVYAINSLQYAPDMHVAFKEIERSLAREGCAFIRVAVGDDEITIAKGSAVVKVRAWPSHMILPLVLKCRFRVENLWHSISSAETEVDESTHLNLIIQKRD